MVVLSQPVKLTFIIHVVRLGFETQPTNRITEMTDRLGKSGLWLPLFQNFHNDFLSSLHPNAKKYAKNRRKRKSRPLCRYEVDVKSAVILFS